MTAPATSSFPADLSKLKQHAGRRWTNPFSLRMTLTIAFTLAAMLPALAFGLWIERNAFRSEVEAVSEKHLLLARNVTEALDRYARDVQASFDLFVETANADQTIRGFDKLGRRLNFNHLCIVSPQGQVLKSVHALAAAPASLPPARMTVLAELASRAPGTISDVMANGAGEPTLYLARPLADGSLAVGALDTGYIRQLQRAIAFGQKGHAAIVDSTGRLLAHPRDPWWREMKDISGVPPVAEMLRGGSGVMPFHSPAANAGMISGYATVATTGWGVMVPQPVSELAARAAKNRLAAFTLLGLFVAAAACVSWLASGLLFRPVSAFIDSASRYTEGTRLQKIPELSAFAPRELVELGNTFNIMAEQILRDRDTLQAQAAAEKQDLLGRVVASVPGLVLRRVADAGGADAGSPVTYPLLSIGRSNVFDLDADALMVDPQSFIHCLHPDDRRTWRAAETRAFEGRSALIDEFRVIGRDGTARWARVIGEPYRNDAGDTVWDSVIIDITQNRRTEEQLRQSQKMEAVGQLTGGVAHDFNNLLAVVLGNLELLREKETVESPRTRLMDSALDATRRGASLTARLLTFSRNQALRPEVTDVNDLIEGMREFLTRTLDETIDLEFYAGSGMQPTRIDRNQLENIILNLAINARDAMPGGGSLIVATELVQREHGVADDGTTIEAGAYIEISVIDTGIGMTPDIRRRAFEPFYTTKGVGRGSGLGLSAVLGFVSQSGGHVELDTRPGSGTAVRLYLPVFQGSRDKPASERETAEQHAAATGEPILLVEDDPGVRDTVCQMLEQLGYTVETAGSGAEARQALLASRPFDLLLTDVSLPGGLTGYDLADFVRQRYPGTRTVFMSGYPLGTATDSPDPRAGARFLQKPFSRQQLATTLRRAIEQAG